MSTIFSIQMRDRTEHVVTGFSIVVNDGVLQIVRPSGAVVAAFPAAGVASILPIEPPVLENIVWTAKDYAINHGLIPFIEEREIKSEDSVINLDDLAAATLVNEGEGVRVRCDGDELEQVIRSLIKFRP